MSLGERSNRLGQRTLRLWLGIACSSLGMDACHSQSEVRHPGHVASPQAALERQLQRAPHSRTERTEDGGLLFTTNFSQSNPKPLQLPHDVLERECKQLGGEFKVRAPAEVPASGLAVSEDVPDAIETILSDADERHVFGHHRCSVGAGFQGWSAYIEPTQLGANRSRKTFYLQTYVKTTSAPEEQLDAAELTADVDDDERADIDNPDEVFGPGLPATGGRGNQQIAEPPISTSPLDERAWPPQAGDSLLQDPHPFGLNLGIDTPEQLAEKLKLELKQASACDGKTLSGLCWQKPGGSQASSLKARFAQLGNQKVLADFELHYPAEAYRWLSRALRNQYGPADNAGDAQTQRWSWLHSNVELSRSGDDVRVYASHKPTLDRAELPKTSAARVPKTPVRIATPWHVQLGYELAQISQARLRAAGFSVPDKGCSDGSHRQVRGMSTRTCRLDVTGVPNVKSAWVRSVDLGDGQPRVAELGYQLDPKGGFDAKLRELKAQHGEPIPSQGGTLQWWTGPVGITLTPAPKAAPNANSEDSSSGPTLRYYHGRALQYFIVAEAKPTPKSS